MSNLVTIGLAMLGAYLVKREALPDRYFWGYIVITPLNSISTFMVPS
jgi:hypothetical protein